MIFLLMLQARHRFAFAIAAAAAILVAGRIGGQQAAGITILYPLNESVFPPEITAPTFLWRDASPSTSWEIDIELSDGSPAIHTRSAGEAPRPAEIDARAASSTNQPP